METEVSQKRYNYVGKERDEETGLYYYGARYYVAWLCRFVSVDPLQFKYPHYSPYQYAGNKPVSYIDLDGLEEAKTGETQRWDSGNLEGTFAYKLFEKTQVVELLKEKFAHGEYSNYEIIFIKDGERIKPAEGTTAIFIINPNNNAIPYGNVKGDDIIKGSKVRVVITVDASETVDDARTLGHEVFLHVDRQLNRIHKILSSDVSSKERASMIHDVFKSGNIYDPKSRVLIGDLGDADHAKILNNSNRNYKEYLKELKDVI